MKFNSSEVFSKIENKIDGIIFNYKVFMQIVNSINIYKIYKIKPH